MRINTTPNGVPIGYIINEAAPEEATKTQIVDEVDFGDGHPRVVGKGILQSAEALNRNRRFYGYGDLHGEVYCDRQQKELIPTGNMLGECGHPLSKDLGRQQQILEPLCSVRYLKIWMEGNDVYALYVGHTNALGDSFDRNLRCRILPAFSLRALGSIENTPKGAKVTGLKVITWDHVIYPSHSNAYTSGIITPAEYKKAMSLTESGNIWTPDDGYLVMEAAYSDACKLVDKSNIQTEYNRRKMNESGLIQPITNENVIDFIKTESFNFHQITESFDMLYENITLMSNNRQVRMTDKMGNTICVNLENYIHNGILNYFCG